MVTSRWSRDEMDYYEFLVSLRDTGVVNMFGASPYLAEEFGLPKREAGKILVSWMDTFKLPEAEQPDDGRDDIEIRRVR